jgi:uncharacterized membrane protein
MSVLAPRTGPLTPGRSRLPAGACTPVKLKLAILRLLAVAALAVCGSILADSLLAQPTFCGFSAGCDDGIFSPTGRPLGVPLPVVGVLGLSVLLCLRRPSAVRIAAPLTRKPCAVPQRAARSSALE